jgi:hypothetical protein
MSKEAYAHGKRGLCKWQKRPILRPSSYGKRGLPCHGIKHKLQKKILFHAGIPVAIAFETYQLYIFMFYGKRDLFM